MIHKTDTILVCAFHLLDTKIPAGTIPMKRNHWFFYLLDDMARKEIRKDLLGAQ